MIKTERVERKIKRERCKTERERYIEKRKGKRGIQRNRKRKSKLREKDT